MGRVLPFSLIDRFLFGQESEIRGCLIDTNFLVAAIYDIHAFHDDAQFLFQKLAEHEVPIYTTVTTRSEFIDVQRRIITTEALMGMLAEDSPWHLSEAAKKELRKHRSWLDGQASKDNLPLLSDSRIKQCKEVFMPRTASGKSGWLEICSHFLEGRLTFSWDELVRQLGIMHLGVTEGESNKIFIKKVEWTEMCALSETTCLSSSDSMILNFLKCSKLSFVISADYDMAYAALADSSGSTVMVPDNLYRNKIKNLNF